MWFGIFTLLVSIAIAGVAAWFSIAGLVAIFSASAMAIMIMAGVLEVGKLVTASWLYRNWESSGWVIKLYLIPAVVVLMVITSMGIFGFLSKAHLDQAGVTTGAIAQVQRVDDEIARQQLRIDLAEERLSRLTTMDSTTVETAVAQQQELIDGAYDRVQGDIDYAQEQLNQIRNQLQIDLQSVDDNYASELAQLDQRLAALDAIVESYTSQGTTSNETRAGNIFRRAEVEVVDNVARGNEIRQEQQTERDDIASQKESLRVTSDARRVALREQANEETTRLQGAIDNYREQAQNSVTQANEEINRLRSLQSSSQEDAQTQIGEINDEIDGYYAEIDALNEEKFEAEAQVRELELEVGPIRYVADMVYGESSTEQLDQAVRLFIILLVIVFDPLAVMLLLAANISLVQHGIHLEGNAQSKKKELSNGNTEATPTAPERTDPPETPELLGPENQDRENTAEDSSTESTVDDGSSTGSRIVVWNGSRKRINRNPKPAITPKPEPEVVQEREDEVPVQRSDEEEVNGEERLENGGSNTQGENRGGSLEELVGEERAVSIPKDNEQDSEDVESPFDYNPNFRSRIDGSRRNSYRDRQRDIRASAQARSFELKKEIEPHSKAKSVEQSVEQKEKQPQAPKNQDSGPNKK